MKSPALSVILPVYNQERYLRAAVHSVLTQTYSDFELLVIDDGSTDATPQILHAIGDSRLRVIRTEHVGFIQALRSGIEEAHAPWLARMDSDDVSAPNRFETQMAFLGEHPECVFVGSAYGIVTPNDRYLAPVERFPWRALTPADIAFKTVSFADASTIFSRRSALDSGLYDEEIPTNERPLWYKMLSRGVGVVLGEPLYYYRLRLGSLSHGEGSKSAREIHMRYHPEAAELVAQPVLPDKLRAKLNGAAGCQYHYLLAGDFQAARQLAVAACRKTPASTYAWKLLLRSALGRPALRHSTRAVLGQARYQPIGRPW